MFCSIFKRLDSLGSVHTASDFDPFSTARSTRESSSIASVEVENPSSNVVEVGEGTVYFHQFFAVV